MGRIKDGSQQSTGSVELANTQTCSRSTTICGFCPICSEVYNQFNTLTAPLTNLTKAKIGFWWTTVEQEAFGKLKVVVCSQLVLVCAILQSLLKFTVMHLILLMVQCSYRKDILLLMNPINSPTLKLNGQLMKRKC